MKQTRPSNNLEKNAKIKATLSRTRERRKDQVCRVFTVKIQKNKLSEKQKEQLKMLFVEAKWIKNHYLSYMQDNDVSVFDCKPMYSKDQVNVKTKDGTVETRTLKFIGSQQIQDVLETMKSNTRTIMSLTKNKKQKFGHLKFCTDYKAIGLKQYGCTWKMVSENKVKIQGISKHVRINGGNQFFKTEGLEYANANLVNRPDGYYLHITTYIDKDKIQKPISNGKSIGVDFGLKTSLTTSEGESFNVCVEESERTKRIQRRVVRSTKGSSNRYKLRHYLQKSYQKTTNQKTDESNKIVAKLKVYDNIYMQDEQLSNWQRSFGSKKVQHSCMGRIKQKLKQLDNCYILAKNIPTTKLCSSCGDVKTLSLADRTFTCECGVCQDRDVHAAMNMITIVNMIKENVQVPAERRDFKRVEFQEAYMKKFGRSYGTMKHEANPHSGGW